MKINFTKKEYQLLLDMIYISDWVMHSHEATADDRNNEYQALRKKILSHYKEMESEDRVHYCKDSDQYYETGVYETTILEKFLEPYEEHVFWEELIGRLAERDVVNQIGEKACRDLDEMERIKRLEEAREKYVNEFSDRGLEALAVTRKQSTVN